MSAEEEGRFWECHRCFSWSKNEPPHGWGNPCPQVVESDQAYIDKLDAERMYYLRAQTTNSDTLGILRTLVGEKGEQ